MIIKQLIFYLLIYITNANNIYISDFNALTNGESTIYAAYQNGIAFNNAVKSASKNDVIILRNNETIYYIPSTNDGSEPYLSNLQNITIKFDGEIYLHNNNSAWPLNPNNEYYNAFDIRDSKNIIITGNGKIYGQGNMWWTDFMLGKIVRQRPSIINIENLVNLLIENLQFYNSPRFNIYCKNILNAEIRYLNIIAKLRNGNMPMLPLNTDGVDVAGKNIYIHHLNISNYDDVVAIKPLKNNEPPLDGDTLNCSENILVEHINIILGVGLSIGSVSSNKDSCVRNVTFQNINAKNPIKLIYIKTGGLDNAESINGLIENITYQNIYAHAPIMWPIYIGPQQQKEPDGTGDGFWPDTNPFVKIRNVILKNIIVKDLLVEPGILRCNLTNPCNNIIFKNLSIYGLKKKYICDGSNTINGKYDKLTNPPPLDCGFVNE